MPAGGASRYPRLEKLFRALVARRWLIVAVYALLLPVAVLLALHVPSDSSIDRLIVQSDPDFIDTRAFQQVFPEGEHVILLAEAADPFSPAVLSAVDALESRLRKLPRVESFSPLALYRRVHPDFAPGAADSSPAERAQIEAFRLFATGTDMLRRQGLVGAGFLGIPLELKVESSRERDETLAEIDAVIADVPAAAPSAAASASPITIRRVGGPYVDAYLESETRRASLKYFPLFGLFIVVLNTSLYRSFRTLVAFLITLAATVSLTVGFAAVAGYSFTIVSSLVPLTVLVTTTATLVYIHSRFVDLPGNGATVDDHQIFALANKFTACTASIFAAAVGFAALAVSRIRPVREMGLWVAGGMVITWIVVFTLFPALQRILRTPTQRHQRVAARWFPSLMDGLPGFSYRWRWVLVPASIALCAAGAIA
ncbi:MAG: MMPL family transporter, partial [Candidatus Binatia bacterium]